MQQMVRLPLERDHKPFLALDRKIVRHPPSERSLGTLRRLAGRPPSHPGPRGIRRQLGDHEAVRVAASAPPHDSTP